jgi:hypothetical protein
MKAKAKKSRKRSDGMAQIRREILASRERVMRAHALGQPSKEFCLARLMGDFLFAPLDLSRVDVPLESEV